MVYDRAECMVGRVQAENPRGGTVPVESDDYLSGYM